MLNVKCKILKFLKENKQKHLDNPRVGKDLIQGTKSTKPQNFQMVSLTISNLKLLRRICLAKRKNASHELGEDI